MITANIFYMPPLHINLQSFYTPAVLLQYDQIVVPRPGALWSLPVPALLHRRLVKELFKVRVF